MLLDSSGMLLADLTGMLLPLVSMLPLSKGMLSSVVCYCSEQVC